MSIQNFGFLLQDPDSWFVSKEIFRFKAPQRSNGSSSDFDLLHKELNSVPCLLEFMFAFCPEKSLSLS
jgi:hypothetical protein